ADVALTGEATLMGDVLPVGGVRAKLLAAERAGMRMVLIPLDNLSDVPDDVAIEVSPVATLAEVADALGLAPKLGPDRERASVRADASTSKTNASETNASETNVSVWGGEHG